jgi:hypothetical protein
VYSELQTGLFTTAATTIIIQFFIFNVLTQQLREPITKSINNDDDKPVQGG